MQLLLLESLDKKATLERAKNLLSSCKTYLNVVGNSFVYKITSDYQFEVSCKEVPDNPLANEAICVLKSVFKGLNSLYNLEYRRIIYEKYIKRYKQKDIYIAIDLNIAETGFYNILNLALLEFSEVFNFGELLVVG